MTTIVIDAKTMTVYADRQSSHKNDNLQGYFATQSSDKIHLCRDDMILTGAGSGEMITEVHKVFKEGVAESWHRSMPVIKKGCSNTEAFLVKRDGDSLIVTRFWMEGVSKTDWRHRKYTHREWRSELIRLTDTDYIVSGSGRDYFEGAYKALGNARKAIELVHTLDTYTGSEIDEWNF